MIFKDRREAGRKLAEELLRYKGKNPVVLGIPRGGIITAAEIAEKIRGELDIIITRKIGAPDNPEYAIGAVGEEGDIWLRENIVSAEGIPADYIKEEAGRQKEEIKRRLAEYRGTKKPAQVGGRIVIITDDGIATGATVLAAIKTIRKKSPQKIVVATPVVPRENVKEIEESSDEFIYLDAPEMFYAVGQFYADFPQTSDEEVKKILAQTK